MNVQSAIPTVDLSTIKGRQQLAWSSGDYAIVGTTLQIVGETLCEAVDLRSNQRVLDVAAGNGNATLAAARRFADVVSTDYVPALLERARARAGAEGLAVQFEQADAENLQFADGAFDVVLSDMAPDTSGVRSADQARSEALFERAFWIGEQTLATGRRRENLEITACPPSPARGRRCGPSRTGRGPGSSPSRCVRS